METHQRASDSEGVTGGPGTKKLKREWPTKTKLALVLLIFLGAAALLGLFNASHMTGFISSCQIVTNVYNFQQSRAEFTTGAHVVSYNISDEDLLFMASMEPGRSTADLRVTKKVAFLFLVKGRIHFEPIWNSFFKGQEELFSVYVHASPDFAPVHERSSVFYGRYIRSQPTGWGEITICDAERRLLATALLDLGNERFVLLSESCLPIFNFSVVYNYLTASKYSFLSVFDDPGEFGRGRYSSGMQPEVQLEQWRKGSQWFELNRKHALSVISDTKYYAKFRTFCVPACYVDEHYIPTLLSIEAYSELANRSITLVDWSRGGEHPATFGEDDVTPEFVQRLQNYKDCTWNDLPDHVCFLFARKFSPGALRPFQQLAPSVLGLG